MKKKIMIAASIALIAGGAFLGVKKSVANKSGDLLMANVEALAGEFTQFYPKGEEEFWEEMTSQNVYNTNGQLEVTIKGVTIKLGSYQSGLIGVLKDCKSSWFSYCDHSQIGFYKL